MKNELLDPFGIYICDLDASVLVLFKEQSHPGRCIVACFADVNRAAKALHAAFHPDKVNYGAYDDTGRHLHFHLVPKYKDGPEWGGVFEMNPQKRFLSQEEYGQMIEKIKAAL